MVRDLATYVTAAAHLSIYKFTALLALWFEKLDSPSPDARWQPLMSVESWQDVVRTVFVSCHRGAHGPRDKTINEK
jgi:hypothetical protein